MMNKQWSFSFSAPLLLVTLILLTAFLSLSYWQYTKAQNKFKIQKLQSSLIIGSAENGERDTSDTFPSDFKQTLNFKQTLASFNLLTDISQDSVQALNDIAIQTTGTIVPNWFIFHDNRMKDWLAGYHVYGLLLIPPNLNSPAGVVLINLGWTPLPEGRRDTLPSNPLELSEKHKLSAKHELDDNSTQLLLSGEFPSSRHHPEKVRGTVEIPVPNQGIFNLSWHENIEPFHRESNQKNTFQWRIQKVDLAQVQSLIDDTLPLRLKLAPFVIRAKVTQTDFPQLARDWQPIQSRGISAEKHLGYALQWLLFAILLVSLFIGLNLKKRPALTTETKATNYANQ